MLAPLLSLSILAAAASALPPAAQPVHYPPEYREQLIHKIYADREQYGEWLRGDAESYLAALERKPFAGKQALTVGRAADNDVRVDDPNVLPHHLRITLLGDTFRVTAVDDSARFFLGETEERDTTLGPATIALRRQGMSWGRYLVRISHQLDPALILFDANNPHLTHDNPGVKHYAYDLSYRYALPIVPNPEPDTIRIESTKGKSRPALRMGWVDFMVGPTRCRLTVTRVFEPGIPKDNLEVFFKDATNGKETCAMGRYVDLPRLGASGNYLLDLNNSQNPACAFSNLFNCPIPPRENTLKIPIPAGEKDLFHLKSH